MAYDEEIRNLALELENIETRLNRVIRAGAELGLIFHHDKIDIATMGQVPPIWNFSFEFRRRVDA